MQGKKGSLQLYLDNLPPDATRKDLKRFVQEAIARLTRRPRSLVTGLERCCIVRLSDATGGTVIHRGLLSIQPPKLALDLIPALRARPFLGHWLEVRRYRHASFAVGTATADISDLLRPRQQTPDPSPRPAVQREQTAPLSAWQVHPDQVPREQAHRDQAHWDQIHRDRALAAAPMQLELVTSTGVASTTLELPPAGLVTEQPAPRPTNTATQVATSLPRNQVRPRPRVLADAATPAAANAVAATSSNRVGVRVMNAAIAPAGKHGLLAH